MVIFSCGIVLSIFYVLILLYEKKRYDTFFSMIGIVTIINIIMNIPYIFIIAFDTTKFSQQITHHSSFTNINYSFIKFTIIEIIYMCILSIVSLLLKNKKISIQKPIEPIRISYIKVLFIITSLVFIFAYFKLLSEIGGLNYLLNNLRDRSNILAGKSNLVSMMKSIEISIVCSVILANKYKKKWVLFFSYLMVIIPGAAFTTLGGRKATLQLIIIYIVSREYFYKPVKLLSKKFLLVLLILIIYFVSVPVLRVSEGFESFDEMSTAITENLNESIRQVSYIESYIFIYNDFNKSNYWKGSSYLDLISYISGEDDKVPLDDGIYIRNRVSGYNFNPGTPYSNMPIKSSWPPETRGIAYANFGIMGIIVFAVLMGIIYTLIYQIFIKYKNIYTFCIYIYFSLNFNLSNLRIVQTILYLINIIIIVIITFITTKLLIRNKVKVK